MRQKRKADGTHLIFWQDTKDTRSPVCKMTFSFWYHEKTVDKEYLGEYIIK